MTKEKRLEELTKYTERTREVLTLSAPQLDEMKNAENYRVHLQESFREIGGLGVQNIETLDKYLFPLLDKDYELSDDDVEVLREFSAMLIDTTSMENIDLPLIYVLADKLLQNAEQSGDIKKIIISADNMVVAACMMMNLSIRFYPDVDVCFHYRDIGLKAGYRLLEYLPKEKFSALPDDECRELVLINTRYIRCLFEWDDKVGEEAEEVKREEFRLMEQALAIAEDPFYREMMPDYLWDTHVFRTLQYLSDFTEDGNCHGYNHEQLVAINGYTKRLIAYLEEHPELVQGCPEEEQKLYIARNGYMSGELSLEEYRQKLTKIMLSVDSKDYSSRSMFVSFSSALEYIFVLDKDNLTEEQKEIVRLMYRDIASYAYRMPKTGVLSFMLTFVCMLLKDFVEIPGSTSFRAMCRQLIAAMHPPTYVHTLNVAAIARCLAGRLIERHPEMFIGVEEANDVADVLNRKGELEDFVYNSALLHDVGKLFIVETIITYGRDLIDEEFEFIKAHPLVGAALLRKFDETAKYSDAALGHHLWYDGSRGYPEEAKNIDKNKKVVVDLIAAADCIDAATDSVGRSYKKGLSFEEVREEFREGSGTRYAPYVVELLDNPSTSKDLQRILSEGRDENYRITFSLLKDL